MKMEKQFKSSPFHNVDYFLFIIVATCTDGYKDQDETDIDCGGASCSPCGLNKNCLNETDCASGNCYLTTHTCQGK